MAQADRGARPEQGANDLANTLALGGDCLADIAVVRAEPGVYGQVASDPTVSRTIDALACERTAWMQMLALIGHPARRWEPKRLRLRLLSPAGRLATTARRVVLHLARAGRWTRLLLDAVTRLRALPGPSG